MCPLLGEDILQLCIEVAVTQAQSSQNAAMLLGMWVAPPLVFGLNVCVFTLGSYKLEWAFFSHFACLGFFCS